VLRRPRAADAEEIFARYAADPDVTRYVGWPRHQSIHETRAFLAWGDEQWEHWPAGPYLIDARATGQLLGSTGLVFEAPDQAATGYVLARDCWGHGFATEALVAMVDLARALGVRRLYAICPAEHRASARVLEKGGFAREAMLRRHSVFPNLTPHGPHDVLRYATALQAVAHLCPPGFQLSAFSSQPRKIG
jgi:ribosomal-protein-alanine N-acetyltransferase